MGPSLAVIPHTDRLVRLGLRLPSEYWLKIVACTFAGYHAAKRGAAGIITLDSTLIELDVSRTRRAFAAAFQVGSLACQFECVAVSSLPAWLFEASALDFACRMRLDERFAPSFAHLPSCPPSGQVVPLGG